MLRTLLQSAAWLRSGSLRPLATSAQHTADDKVVPRRALMYVPGSDERKLAKIKGMSADCVVIDCEDGVAHSRKEEARKMAAEFVNAGNRPTRGELGIRINSVSSGLIEGDLAAIASGCTSIFPDAIMLPKVDSIDDLDVFSRFFRQYLEPPLQSAKKRLNLVLWIESAMALLEMQSILKVAVNLRHHLSLNPGAVVFGSDDFCADIGATRSAAGTEIAYARQRFVTVCKAYRLQAIDAVYIDFKDLEGLERQCIEGANFGFTGKQVIHPGQLETVEKCFTPAPEKIAWAKDLISNYESHSTSGTGAFVFHGQMIDMPLLLQAKNIVAIADAVDQ